MILQKILCVGFCFIATGIPCLKLHGALCSMRCMAYTPSSNFFSCFAGQHHPSRSFGKGDKLPGFDKFENRSYQQQKCKTLIWNPCWGVSETLGAKTS